MLTCASMATKAEGTLIKHCLNKNHDIIEDAIDGFPLLGTEAEAVYSTSWERSYSMGKDYQDKSGTLTYGGFFDSMYKLSIHVCVNEYLL